ncbi:MAG: hypothetical protein CTY36_18630 [Methylocystis sp.]|nr:MAG: hypothetical protein CTY36_18630 [Methylocystis sp.]
MNEGARNPGRSFYCAKHPTVAPAVPRCPIIVSRGAAASPRGDTGTFSALQCSGKTYEEENS